MRATKQKGFALGEVIIVLVISGVLVSALLAGLIALVRGLQPQNLKLAGETLPVAPTFGSFPSAVRLHQSLTDLTLSARAIYVFGGRHLAIPADAPATKMLPLRRQSLPVIADFSAGLPLDAKTFYELYAAGLGDQEHTATSEDFSIVLVGATGDALCITGLVQVRRRDVSLSDGGTSLPYTVRDVQLWDLDGTQRYMFAERPHQAAGVFIGAVHTWMRFRLSDGAAEEGPACVAFPDPWLWAGRRGQSDDIPPFSRFVYFLAVSP